MFIKSLQIGLMGFLLCAANAWAGPASIQGIVKDAQGKPIKGADVQDRVAEWQATLQYGQRPILRVATFHRVYNPVFTGFRW